MEVNVIDLQLIPKVQNSYISSVNPKLGSYDPTSFRHVFLHPLKHPCLQYYNCSECPLIKSVLLVVKYGKQM